MLLRQSKRVNYAVLNGIGKTVDEMAEAKKSGVESDSRSISLASDSENTEMAFHESFSSPMQAKRAEIEELESEMEALELEERAAKLQQRIRQKKEAIERIKCDTVQPSSHQQVPPGMDGPNSRDINLGELYAGHINNTSTHKSKEAVTGSDAEIDQH